MTTAEFSRPFDRRHLPPAEIALAAEAAERAALARRFGLVRIDRLEAWAALTDAGDTVEANGRFEAEIVQTCAVSGEDLPVAIAEPLALRFVPAPSIDDEELELAEAELDEIPVEGDVFDLGEAVAQSLALAIDPYATGPEAERVRQEAGLSDEASSGPFAALAALRKQ